MIILKSSDERVRTEFMWNLTGSVFGFLRIIVKSRFHFKTGKTCYFMVPLIGKFI